MILALCIVETTFLDSLNRILEEHSADKDFGISQLCRTILMSRTDLHRKIVRYTGLSTSIYIREFRLQKAKELLRETKLPINQIAYETGFSDHGYFTKCFKKKYGIPPSAIRVKDK